METNSHTSQAEGDSSQIAGNESDVPGKLIAQLCNWTRGKDVHLFTGTADSTVYGGCEKVKNPDLYFALEGAAKSLADYYFQGGHGRKVASTNTLADGYKLVPRKVVLKGRVSWSDLMQMRRARSVYLGKRVEGGYLTQIPIPEPTPVAEVSVLPLAKSIVLTDKGLTVQLDDLDTPVEFKTDTPQYASWKAYAESVMKIGLDPANLEFKDNGPLGRIDERGMQGLEMPVQEQAQPAQGSEMPNTLYSAMAELETERMNQAGASPEEVVSSETGEPVSLEETSPKPPETEQTTNAKSPEKPNQGDKIKNEIVLGETPFITINSTTYSISDASHLCLKTLMSEAKGIPVLAVDHRPIGKNTEIMLVSIGDEVFDVQKTVKEAAVNAGVPSVASAKELTPDELRQRARSLLSELIVISKGSTLEKYEEKAEPGTVDAGEGKSLRRNNIITKPKEDSPELE